MTKKLRIGLVSHEFPPFVGGGIGSYVAAAAVELARAGHRVHVFANGALSAPVVDPAVPGLTVHRLPLFTDSYQRPPTQAAYLDLEPTTFSYVSREAAANAENTAAWAIAEAIRDVHQSNGLDVVEVPDCMAEAFYAVRRRLTGEDLPPVVIHLHGNTLESYSSADDPITLGHTSVRSRLRREDLTICHADSVLCPSQSGEKRYLGIYGGNHLALRDVIPYYFAPACPATLPPEIGNWPFAVMVGRIEPRKGTDFAVEAFAQVADLHPELRLVLCGAGEQWMHGESVETMLQARLPKHLLPRVVCIGRQPREVAIAVLSRATLMLHPARWDNWPNAVLEAMSVGSCCIVSSAGGQADMVEPGKSGVVVPVGDVPALAKAMNDLLKDHRQRQRIGAAARRRMTELCDAALVTRRKIAAYERTISNAEDRRRAELSSMPVGGVCVIDAAGSSPEQAQATHCAVTRFLDAAAGQWDKRWITEDGHAPSGWQSAPARGHELPWLGLPTSAVLLWCRAGAAPDAQAIPELLRLLAAAPDAAATFLWLAPDRTGRFFPHRCDLGWRDILIDGGTLPAIFAVRVGDLQDIVRRTGLTSPESRIAALLAAVTARTGRFALHTARLAGRMMGQLPTLNQDSQQRALGFLELLGFAPRGLARIGGDPELVNDNLHNIPQRAGRAKPESHRPNSWTAAAKYTHSISRHFGRLLKLLFRRPFQWGIDSQAYHNIADSSRGSRGTKVPHLETMRICLVGHEYPPYPGGGIATYGRNAAHALAAAGHETHVITNSATFGSTDPVVHQRVHRDGMLTIHRYDLLDERYHPPSDAAFCGIPLRELQHPHNRWAGDVATFVAFRLAEAVAELHAQHRFDVVEVPDMFAEGFFLARRRKAFGPGEMPPICVLGHTSSRETYRAAHDAWQLGGELQRHRMRLEDACLSEADALITPSASLMDRYATWFCSDIPPIRAVIPNFFSAPTSTPDVPRLGLLDAPGPLLLVLGRVEPRKGSDVALSAFARLADDFPDLHLAFVGEANHWWPGESFADLCAAQLPAGTLGRVLKPGLLSYNEVFSALRRATVVLHPSRWDNWPNAVLEAMSVGACCAVSDNGGHAEMIEDGISGRVFPTGDDAALARILRELIRDPQQRSKLGAAAAERVAALCDPQHILPRKLEVYRAAAATRMECENLMPALVVLDVDGADLAHVNASAHAIRNKWPQSSVAKFVLGNRIDHVPEHFKSWPQLDRLPWAEMEPSAPVVWIRAGAEPDSAGFDALLRMAKDRDHIAGASLWLDSIAGPDCPPADLTEHDVVLIGANLPVVVCCAARHLFACRSLIGARGPSSRMAILVSMISMASGRPVRHTGSLGGRDHGEPLRVDHIVQTALLGRLTVERLADRAAIIFGA